MTNREWATLYVAQRLEIGYGADAAEAEILLGCSGYEGPGWEISRGKITVPPFVRDENTVIRPGEKFRFRDLVAEIEAEQNNPQMELAL